VQKGRSSWLTLVAFCATSALLIALLLAVVFASATVVFAVGQSSPGSERADGKRAVPERKFSGVITDADCGARHAVDSGKSPAECARACVRNGSRYVLVDGERTYTLAGSIADLDRLAGQRASVSGTLEGDTIHVRSVTTH